MHIPSNTGPADEPALRAIDEYNKDAAERLRELRERGPLGGGSTGRCRARPLALAVAVFVVAAVLALERPAGMQADPDRGLPGRRLPTVNDHAGCHVATAVSSPSWPLRGIGV